MLKPRALPTILSGHSFSTTHVHAWGIWSDNDYDRCGERPSTLLQQEQEVLQLQQKSGFTLISVYLEGCGRVGKDMDRRWFTIQHGAMALSRVRTGRSL